MEAIPINMYRVAINSKVISYPDFFLFSVWYSGGDAKAPMFSEITLVFMDEWQKDLQQIRDLGFNTVRTWVEWQRTEPRLGEYNFEKLRLLQEK